MSWATEELTEEGRAYAKAHAAGSIICQTALGCIRMPRNYVETAIRVCNRMALSGPPPEPPPDDERP